MMKRNILTVIVVFSFLLVACMNQSNSFHDENKTIEENDEKLSSIKVVINQKSYILNLEDNKTVEEFIDLLPQEFSMSELNGNEKYVYMDHTLTVDSYNPKHIEKGDVMLFGDDCLVLFYQSFDTSYQYTKIGHINHLDDLGKETIIVTFEK